jgi:DNA sulfur modification protein DndD
MIFKQLMLRDFGLYAGTQTLDLAPEDGRPIVLIGGTNGAGKTTILEAITLALYGRRALGARVSADEYEEHLRSRMHVAPGAGRAAESAVSLSFVRDESGVLSEYEVARTWRPSAHAGRIRETMVLTRGGAVVEDLPEDAYQDFLDGLLPPGVAGLFLFDGEKIQAIADDENGEQLADAVRKLLGLDLVVQLRGDLRRYAAREPQSDSGLAGELESAELALERYATEVKERRDRRATLQARFDLFANRAEQARQRFIAEGGTLAQSRVAHEDRARAAAAERAAAVDQVRTLTQGLLPFALAPSLAARVVGRLSSEQQGADDAAIERRLEERAEHVRRHLKTPDGRGIAALRRALGLDARSTLGRVHDFTPQQVEVMLDQLQTVLTTIPEEAVLAGERLRAASEEFEQAQTVVDAIPDAGAVERELLELNGAERELGALELELRQVDEALAELDQEKKIVERKASRAHERLQSVDAIATRARLALRAASVLEEFARRSERAKLAEIEIESARLYNRLSRKGSFLSRISIDPETFHVELIRWDGAGLPKALLSAGEKQLFAIAVLWALAKTARRSVPVVVDTPLGRLDAEHRERLLTEYFPHVSHQVVVLSTDTEVDVEAANLLEPHLARQLLLAHDAATATTRVEQGYFDPASKELRSIGA